MKRIVAIIALVVVLALALPTGAFAAGRLEGRVIFGGHFTLASGETLQGDLAVFGGEADLESGSRVTGGVFLIGGNIRADGRIDGDVGIVGGSFSLGEDAVVGGDVLTLGGAFHRAPGARVEGQVISEMNWTIPSIEFPNIGRTFVPFRFFSVSPAGSIVWYLLRSFLLAALGVLAIMFWPQPAGRVSQAVVDQPVIAGALGLLSLIVAGAILIVLAITICLIPVSVLGFIALGVAVVFGFIAIGMEVGQRLAQVFKWELHPAAAAGLGTLLLALVVHGIGMIDCIGWVAPLLAWSLALGGVILTRFGSRVYSPAQAAIPEEVKGAKKTSK